MQAYEKSCGAVIYKKDNGKTEFLLIHNKKGNAEGHWGFPKGHVEGEETETETAVREISEETGLTVRFIPPFRAVTRYSPREGVTKDAVYFLAEYTDGDITLQQSEVAASEWLEYSAAFERVTNSGDKDILKKANDFMNGGEC